MRRLQAEALLCSICQFFGVNIPTKAGNIHTQLTNVVSTGFENF
jgi:hypothetical protein